MFSIKIGYGYETLGLLVAMVALQQVWGVDFNTAVARADEAVRGLVQRHRGKAVVFEASDAVALMRSVAPPSRS